MLRFINLCLAVLCSAVRPVLWCGPQELVARLLTAGAMSHTVVVAAREGAPLGEQYAAMCMACSIGGGEGGVGRGRQQSRQGAPGHTCV